MRTAQWSHYEIQPQVVNSFMVHAAFDTTHTRAHTHTHTTTTTTHDSLFLSLLFLYPTCCYFIAGPLSVCANLVLCARVCVHLHHEGIFIYDRSTFQWNTTKMNKWTYHFHKHATLKCNIHLQIYNTNTTSNYLTISFRLAITMTFFSFEAAARNRLELFPWTIPLNFSTKMFFFGLCYLFLPAFVRWWGVTSGTYCCALSFLYGISTSSVFTLYGSCVTRLINPRNVHL